MQHKNCAPGLCERRETCADLACPEHPDQPYNRWGGGRPIETKTHRVNWQQEAATKRSDAISRPFLFIAVVLAVLITAASVYYGQPIFEVLP
jgi:hypothetical protein